MLGCFQILPHWELTLYAYSVLSADPRANFSVRRLLTFSWPLTIGNLISFGYNSFDCALLVVFVPLALLGVYNAAIYAFTALSGVTVALNNALLPVFSRISSRGDRPLTVGTLRELLHGMQV